MFKLMSQKVYEKQITLKLTHRPPMKLLNDNIEPCLFPKRHMKISLKTTNPKGRAHPEYCIKP